jgi:hypothetical protein
LEFNQKSDILDIGYLTVTMFTNNFTNNLDIFNRTNDDEMNVSVHFPFEPVSASVNSFVLGSLSDDTGMMGIADHLISFEEHPPPLPPPLMSQFSGGGGNHFDLGSSPLVDTGGEFGFFVPRKASFDSIQFLDNENFDCGFNAQQGSGPDGFEVEATMFELNVESSGSDQDAAMFSIDEEQEPNVYELDFSLDTSMDVDPEESHEVLLSTAQVDKLRHLTGNLEHLQVANQVFSRLSKAIDAYQEYKESHTNLSNMQREFLKEQIASLELSKAASEGLRQCITKGGKSKLTVIEAEAGAAFVAYLREVKQDVNAFNHLLNKMQGMMNGRRTHAKRPKNYQD